MKARIEDDRRGGDRNVERCQQYRVHGASSRPARHAIALIPQAFGLAGIVGHQQDGYPDRHSFPKQRLDPGDRLIERAGRLVEKQNGRGTAEAALTSASALASRRWIAARDRCIQKIGMKPKAGRQLGDLASACFSSEVLDHGVGPPAGSGGDIGRLSSPFRRQ